MFRLISMIIAVLLLIVGWFVLDPTALPAAASPLVPAFVTVHTALSKVIPVSEMTGQLSKKFSEISALSQSAEKMGTHVVIDDLVKGLASEVSRLPADKVMELRAMICATESGMLSPDASASSE